MESQPQNPEFRINPESFYPCLMNVCNFVMGVAPISSVNMTIYHFNSNTYDV